MQILRVLRIAKRLKREAPAKEEEECLPKELVPRVDVSEEEIDIGNDSNSDGEDSEDDEDCESPIARSRNQYKAIKIPTPGSKLWVTDHLPSANSFKTLRGKR